MLTRISKLRNEPPLQQLSTTTIQRPAFACFALKMIDKTTTLIVISSISQELNLSEQRQKTTKSNEIFSPHMFIRSLSFQHSTHYTCTRCTPSLRKYYLSAHKHKGHLSCNKTIELEEYNNRIRILSLYINTSDLSYSYIGRFYMTTACVCEVKSLSHKHVVLHMMEIMKYRSSELKLKK